jgi:hypothetical protein
LLLQRATKRFGRKRGRPRGRDLRTAEDPKAPVTVQQVIEVQRAAPR